jgi:hypothetical protein
VAAVDRNYYGPYRRQASPWTVVLRRFRRPGQARLLRDHGVRAPRCLRVFGSNPISDYLRAVIAYLPLVLVAIAVVAVGGGGITTMAQRC